MAAGTIAAGSKDGRRATLLGQARPAALLRPLPVRVAAEVVG